MTDSSSDPLLAGYRRFRAHQWPRARAAYETLAEAGQTPHTLFLACSDSRADPALIFNADLDAKYDRYTNAPAQAGSDEGSDDPNDEGGQDLSGRVLQRAPEYSGSLQLGFIGALPWMHLPFALGVVAEGASHQFLNVDLDPIDSQPGYLRYNAFVGLSDGSGRLTLRLIGRNLTDETVRREAADIALVGAHSVGVYPPRRFAAELGYRF